VTLDELEAAVGEALRHEPDRYDAEPGGPLRGSETPLIDGEGSWVNIDGTVSVQALAARIYNELLKAEVKL
jgi:hypothetical protein